MKLQHQIFFLLAFPLLGQLVSVGAIIFSSTRVDAVAKQELAAKKVIALCQELGFLHGQLVLRVATPRFFTSGGVALDNVMIDSLVQKTNELVMLTRDNSQASPIAARMALTSKRFLVYMHELSASYERRERKLYSAQFLEGFEFMEALKVVIDQMENDAYGLLQIYGQAAKEFEPTAMTARRDMRNSLIAAGLFNVILVVALAVAIQKKTLDRLQMLMTNMQHFAAGGQEHQRLQGTDELAELDDAFSRMASQRNRLEEIRKSMSAMITHDLRSPLTSMEIGLDILIEDDVAQDPDKLISKLKRLRSETQRLRRLTNTLLDIERIQDGRLETELAETPCDVLLTTAIEAMRAWSEKKAIEFKQTNPAGLVCLCDQDRTLQVLVNLISNAIKFAPKRSTIEVAVHPSDSGKIRFSVLDTGPGIPEEKVGQLFNKFSQLDQPAEIRKTGSGLGLYICKMLIAAQKGELGYISRPEGGSCFWFELPASPTPTG